MDIKVNKNQLERVAIKWLNKNFGDLTPKKHKNRSNSVYYVNSNNKVMMEYDQKNERVFIDYYNIWLTIESLFHFKYDDTKLIMKIWLEETYKLRRITPYLKNFIDGNNIKESNIQKFQYIHQSNFLLFSHFY